MNYDPTIYDGKHTVLQQLEALKKQYKEAVDTINTFPTVEQLEPKIEGSETVVVDVNEAGTALEVHLDAEVVSDINRSLKTPVANPSEKVLVAIGTDGAQENIPVSKVGGGKLYLHTITISDSNYELSIKMEIYSTKVSDPFRTLDSISAFLEQRGNTGPFLFWNDMPQAVAAFIFMGGSLRAPDFTKEFSEGISVMDTVKEV
jgi:hypothetical protein